MIDEKSTPSCLACHYDQHPSQAMLIHCTLELIAGILELKSERATASFQIRAHFESWLPSPIGILES